MGDGSRRILVGRVVTGRGHRYTRMQRQYNRNEQMKDVQPPSDCEQYAQRVLLTFYTLFVASAFAGASVIFTVSPACQAQHSTLYRGALGTIVLTMLSVVAALVAAAKRKASGPGGAAMTRFSISISSFILMFMAPISLAFSLNHKACYLEDAPRAKQALGCTFMMALNFGCVITSVSPTWPKVRMFLIQSHGEPEEALTRSA